MLLKENLNKKILYGIVFFILILSGLDYLVGFSVIFIIIFIVMLLFFYKSNFNRKVTFLIYFSIFQPYFIIMKKNVTIIMILVPVIFLQDIIRNNINFNIKNNKEILVLILFIFFQVVSIFNSHEISQSIMNIAIWGYYIVLFFWVSNYKDKINTEKVFNSLFNAGIIVGILGIIQFIALNFFNMWGKFTSLLSSNMIFRCIYGGLSDIIASSSYNWTKGGFIRASSIFSSASLNGMFSIIILSFSLMYFLNFKTRKSMACTLIMEINLLLSFSRSSWVGFTIGIIFVLILLRKNRTKAIIFFIILFCFIYAVLLATNTADDVINIITSIFNVSTDTSNLGRLSIWQENIELIKLNPLIGSGTGNYDYIYRNFYNVYADIKFSAHSAYFCIAVESGILGLICFISFFVLPIKNCFNIKWNLDKNVQIFATGVIIMSISVLGQYLFDYSFGEIRYMNIIFILWGVLYNIRNFALIKK